jgi:hypothetical protein
MCAARVTFVVVTSLVAAAFARGDKPSEVLVGALFPFAEDGYLYSGDAQRSLALPTPKSDRFFLFSPFFFSFSPLGTGLLPRWWTLQWAVK